MPTRPRLEEAQEDITLNDDPHFAQLGAAGQRIAAWSLQQEKPQGMMVHMPPMPTGTETPPSHGTSVNWRLSAHDVHQLEAASTMADLDYNTRQRARIALRRAIQRGTVPADAVAEYSSNKGSKGGEPLTFMLRWARGEIPDASATLEQRVTTVTARKEMEDWGHMNWNELMQHLGGVGELGATEIR